VKLIFRENNLLMHWNDSAQNNTLLMIYSHNATSLMSSYESIKSNCWDYTRINVCLSPQTIVIFTFIILKIHLLSWSSGHSLLNDIFRLYCIPIMQFGNGLMFTIIIMILMTGKWLISPVTFWFTVYLVSCPDAHQWTDNK